MLRKRKALEQEYEEKYGPITYYGNTSDSWQWNDGPWPWENEASMNRAKTGRPYNRQRKHCHDTKGTEVKIYVVYQKKLQYPVNIKQSNPAIAKLIMSQLGGPHGEKGAADRYLQQRYSMPYASVVGMLTDIGTEELAHQEIVSSIITQPHAQCLHLRIGRKRDGCIFYRPYHIGLSAKCRRCTV